MYCSYKTRKGWYETTREQENKNLETNMIAKRKFDTSAENQIRKISISKGKSQRLKIGEQRHKAQHQNKIKGVQNRENSPIKKN